MKIILPLAAVSVLAGMALASYSTRAVALPDCQAIYEQCLADGVSPAICEEDFVKCESIGHGAASHSSQDATFARRHQHD